MNNNQAIRKMIQYKITINHVSNYLKGVLHNQFNDSIVSSTMIRSNNHTIIIKCNGMIKNSLVYKFQYSNDIKLIIKEVTKWKQTLKLNRLDSTWYCSKELFKQLLNVTIIK